MGGSWAVMLRVRERETEKGHEGKDLQYVVR